jgi:tetratricopeptide (TPR) repeat protein
MPTTSRPPRSRTRQELLEATLLLGADRRAALRQLGQRADALPVVATLFTETRSPAVLGIAASLLEDGDWVAAAAAWAQAADLRASEVSQLVSDLAWSARARRESALPELRRLDLETLEPHAVEDVVRVYSLLQSLRYDFRFNELLACLGRLGPAWTHDSLVAAFTAFALLATGRPTEGLGELERARALAPDDPKVLHLLVHGVWFADDLPRRADLALDLCNRLLVLDARGAVVQLRRGAALRWKGDYRAALAAFDEGMALLAPEQVEIHADFVRERTVAAMAMEAHTMQARMLDELRDEGRARAAELQAQASDSIFKVVEVLGLFIALAGLLATSGATLVVAGSPRERVGLLATALLGILGFFLLLRLIVRPTTSRTRSARGTARWWRRSGTLDPAEGQS